MTKRLVQLAFLLLFASLAHGQAVPTPRPHQNFVDNAGNPCAGCSLYSYLAGTTTPTPTYADNTQTSQNPNPIVLDTAGGANIWLDPAITYKFVLFENGATQWTVDQVPPNCTSGGCTFTGPIVGTTASFSTSLSVGSFFNVGISTFAQLQSAVTNCASLVCQLYITGNIVVPSNYTVPYYAVLTFLHGGQLQPNSGITVTINGPITDTNQQIFGGSGTIAGLSVVRPEWSGNGATCTTGACPSVMTAINELGSSGGVVKLTYGTYRSGFEGGSNILALPNITIQGVQQPGFNSSTPTALSNGSIIQGTFAVETGANNLTVSNVGFDMGSAVVTALFSGTASDSFSISNPTQTVGAAPVSNVNAQNVSCLAQSASAAFHCFLAENVANSTFRNITGYYGVHGMIVKGVHVTADTLYFHGHNDDCLIVKSDNYAPTNNVTISNLHCNNVAATSGGISDTGGVILQAESAPLADIALTNFTLSGTNWGVSTIVSSSSDSRIAVSNGTVDFGGSAGSPAQQFCIGDSGTGTYNYASYSNIECNNYQYATYFPVRMDSSNISNLNSNNSAQGIWLNGANTVISNVYIESDAGFNSSLVTSNVGGSSISVQNLTEFGAFSPRVVVSNGAHVAFGETLDGTGLFSQNTVILGNPFTVQGAPSATNDFDVEDSTGSFNNLLVADNGTVTARGNINANGYEAQGRTTSAPIIYLNNSGTPTPVPEIKSVNCIASAGTCSVSFATAFTTSIDRCLPSLINGGSSVGSSNPTVWVASQSTTAVTFNTSSSGYTGGIDAVCYGQ